MKIPLDLSNNKEATLTHFFSKGKRSVWVWGFVGGCLTWGCLGTAAPRSGGGAAWVRPPVSAPGVTRQVFHSAAAGTDVSFEVYTPPEYNRDAARRFPVIYWLHGTASGNTGVAPLSGWFDRGIRAGKMPPVLVVFPNGLNISMWCDSKDGRVPMETILIRELLPYVDSHFRTVADRRGRVLEGFSMGGYGAARLGFKYPELFGAVSNFAGGPLDLEFAGPRATQNPRERSTILNTTYGGDLRYFAAQSPLTLMEAHREALQKNLNLRMVVGSLDETADLNRDFSNQLTRLGIPHTFQKIPGVEHKPMPLFQGMGEDFWAFYRNALNETP